MARKKKKRPKGPAAPPRFDDGAAVRVKAGTPHPNYPDIPLGGWAGTVVDYNGWSRPPRCQVEWSAATTAQVPGAYRARCARDGEDPNYLWLPQDLLEADLGSAPVIERPTVLRPPPLNLCVPDDIALAALGLTSDDEAPPVSAESLRRFHQYLSARLRFPFNGLSIKSRRSGPPEVMRVRVLRLLPVEKGTLETGLLVAAEVNGAEKTVPLVAVFAEHANSQIPELLAYHTWFTGNPADEAAGWSRVTLREVLVGLLAAGAGMGMIVGTVFQTFPGAGVAAQVGAVLLALIFGVRGARRPREAPPGEEAPIGGLAGGLLGLVMGVGLGVTVGCALLVWPGTLCGFLVGLVLATVLAALGREIATVLTLLGSSLAGPVVYAFLRAEEPPWSGLLYGALGGVGVMVLFLGFWYVLGRFAVPRGGNDVSPAGLTPPGS